MRIPSRVDLRESSASCYALEGSVAIAGALVQWVRDNFGLITSSAEIESLARTVDDNGGIYFVPAFSGLFAPYWRSDARGAIVGLSRFNTNAHLARATLEAICYQSRDVSDAMTKDSGVTLETLKVDGGVTQNELCMPVDPVYSGKGLAGLIALVRSGRWKSDADIIFIHTGGAPALFAYQSALGI